VHFYNWPFALSDASMSQHEMKLCLDTPEMLDEMNSSVNSSSHDSYRSTLSKNSLDSHNSKYQKEFGLSCVSLERTAPISDCESLWNLSFRSEACDSPRHTKERLSPLGLAVKKFAKELQQNDPPPSEKHCQMILQSLWNILLHCSSSALTVTGQPVALPIEGEESKKSSATKAVAVNNGAVPALTSVMKNYKESIKIQSRGILLLGAIGEDDPEHQEAIAECHGVSFILAAMIVHRKSPTLCLEACSSLYKVMNKSQRAASQLAHGDGVRTLWETMKTHLKHQGIHQYALSVLCLVASDDALLKKIEDPELFEVVVNAMNKHKKVKPVLQFGNKLLHSLATRGTNRTKSSLVWSQAPTIILKTLKYFATQHEVQLSALESLLALSIERPEARCMICDAGGVVVLQDLMKKHPDNQRIQKLGCEILGFLL